MKDVECIQFLPVQLTLEPSSFPQEKFSKLPDNNEEALDNKVIQFLLTIEVIISFDSSLY